MLETMDEAKIADTKPCVLDLEPGDYWWCACGLSEGQPFCDGSHKGTSFTPQKVTISEARKVALCACKRSADPPMCDGSHSKLG